MPRQITDLDIEEVSLVDKGANKKQFFLMKRQGDSNKDIIKGEEMEDFKAHIEHLKKQVNILTTWMDTLKADGEKKPDEEKKPKEEGKTPDDEKKPKEPEKEQGEVSDKEIDEVLTQAEQSLEAATQLHSQTGELPKNVIAGVEATTTAIQDLIDVQTKD